MEQNVDSQVELYKLRGSKAAVAFYSSFNEMLTTMSLRNGVSKTKKL